MNITRKLFVGSLPQNAARSIQIFSEANGSPQKESFWKLL